MPDRRALVVRGGWDGHSPVPATDGFLPVLRERGLRAARRGTAVAIESTCERPAAVPLTSSAGVPA